MNLYESFSNLIPEALADKLRIARTRLRHLSQWPAARFHPWRQLSIHHLNRMRDHYRGKRCFVIGNGPSLNQMDVSLLEDEFTFGMNRVYLAFEEWGFQTSFLVSVNNLVIEQSRQDLLDLDMVRYFSWHARNLLLDGEDLPPKTYFLHTTYGAPKFALNAAGRLWEGATVTYVCLQLAYHLGFTDVILIGVDHSFKTTGKANQTVVSKGADPNHFRKEYFGEGFQWQLPDLETSEKAYRMAREAYQEDGRIIRDATVGGELDIFPKVNYYSLFPGEGRT